jgi:hypothetical protein
VQADGQQLKAFLRPSYTIENMNFKVSEDYYVTMELIILLCPTNPIG